MLLGWQLDFVVAHIVQAERRNTKNRKIYKIVVFNVVHIFLLSGGPHCLSVYLFLGGRGRWTWSC